MNNINFHQNRNMNQNKAMEDYNKVLNGMQSIIQLSTLGVSLVNFYKIIKDSIKDHIKSIILFFKKNFSFKNLKKIYNFFLAQLFILNKFNKKKVLIQRYILLILAIIVLIIFNKYKKLKLELKKKEIEKSEFNKLFSNKKNEEFWN